MMFWYRKSNAFLENVKMSVKTEMILMGNVAKKKELCRRSLQP